MTGNRLALEKGYTVGITSRPCRTTRREGLKVSTPAPWELLPHRYPFLMVDRVLEVEPGRKAVALKNVSMNEPFFQGHFPGTPIMPGVLILEAMAQTCAVALGGGGDSAGRLGVLTGVDQLRFRRPVRPGDQLVLEAELLRKKGPMGKCRVRAMVGDAVVAEAIILFAEVEADQLL